MNAVGIDVSKGKSMVAIMRPFGEIVSAPFEIKHTASDINSLVELINSVEGESRIVMEHTGRYYEVLAHQLSEANLFVSVILSRLVDTFFSRISPTMQLPPKHHSIAYVLPWAEGLHWQSRSSGCSNS